MTYIKVALPVDAPLEVLWELLIDKIEHPQAYVPALGSANQTVVSYCRLNK